LVVCEADEDAEGHARRAVGGLRARECRERTLSRRFQNTSSREQQNRLTHSNGHFPVNRVRMLEVAAGGSVELVRESGGVLSYAAPTAAAANEVQQCVCIVTLPQTAIASPPVRTARLVLVSLTPPLFPAIIATHRPCLFRGTVNDSKAPAD
jgi:hypothetical protein